MNILAIDCIHETCSAAFFDGKKVVSEIVESMERGQAERLLPMVREVLEKAHVGFEDVDAVAVTTGPGSFTGVRVGLAAADGIALAANLPMIGVSMLEATAWKVYARFRDVKKLCLVLETKRDDFYAQCFEEGQSVTSPAVWNANDLKNLTGYVFAGNAVKRLVEEAGELPVIETTMPTAADIALFASNKPAERKYPEPLYLREAEVTLCRK